MNIDNSIFFALVEEQLQAGQNVRISLKGISMLPTLRAGDVLTVVPLKGDAEVGDVVLFRFAGQHLVHRVVGREGDKYIIQGDNNYSTETAGRVDVRARVVPVETPGGHTIATDSEEWRRLSRRSLCRKRMKNIAIRLLGRRGRRQLRPW